MEKSSILHVLFQEAYPPRTKQSTTHPGAKLVESRKDFNFVGYITLFDLWHIHQKYWLHCPCFEMNSATFVTNPTHILDGLRHHTTPNPSAFTLTCLS